VKQSPKEPTSPSDADEEKRPLQVRDIPSRLRPREEMERLGAAGVSDDALLAIVLRSGTHGKNVVDVARGLLQQYGSLGRLATLSVNELASLPGIGKVKAQVLAASFELARRLSEERVDPSYPVRTPADVGKLLGNAARLLDREVFWVIHLDSRNRLKGPPQQVTQGLLDASLAHPREVFREAIRSGCAAVIVAHNHPSGDPTPSAEDIRLTKQLVEAGKIIDIKVLDHVIIGQPDSQRESGVLSLREAGLAQF